MVQRITHSKVTTIPDDLGDDPQVVSPVDWNDDHVLEGFAIRPDDDLEFWVDGATGSDVTGDGSQLNPWATNQHMFDHLQTYDLYDIHVDLYTAAGTYDEHLQFPKLENVGNQAVDWWAVSQANTDNTLVVIKPTVHNPALSGALYLYDTEGLRPNYITFDASDAGFGGWECYTAIGADADFLNCRFIPKTGSAWYVGYQLGSNIGHFNCDFVLDGSHRSIFYNDSGTNGFGGAMVLESGTPTLTRGVIESSERGKNIGTAATWTGWGTPSWPKSTLTTGATLSTSASFPGTGTPVIDNTASINGIYGVKTISGTPDTGDLATNDTFAVFRDTATDKPYIAARDDNGVVVYTEIGASGTGYAPGGTDVALADGGTGASLSDPGADRVLFWDDTAGAVTWLTMGTGLTITGTTLDAATGGAPGGSNTQVQFNDSSAFGGDSGLTFNKTTNQLVSDNGSILSTGLLSTNVPGLQVVPYWNAGGVAFTAALIDTAGQIAAANDSTGLRIQSVSSTSQYALTCGATAGSNLAFIRADGLMAAVAINTADTATAALEQNGSTPGFRLKNTAYFAFSSTGDWWNTIDAAFYRNAAGIIEVNNGASGTYRDLKARAYINDVVTVTNLGSASPSGQRKFVSDANATTFASVVAGSGSNPVPVYSDGTNWRIG